MCVISCYDMILAVKVVLNPNTTNQSNSAANKDTMSKIWMNWDTLSDWVENNVGKREIARYEQFLFFSKCFQKLSADDVSKWVSME